MEAAAPFLNPMPGLRDLPSVDQLLQTVEAAGLAAEYGRPLVVQALRLELDSARAVLRSGDPFQVSDLLPNTHKRLAEWTQPSLQAVINAGGVILHTNLGRAPLSSAALRAAVEAAEGYSTLEYDLKTGKRGSRLIHAEQILTRLTGAAAAAVVNNNAAAVLLALTALARRRGVVIARTQLVEIGGGFRVPEVMKQSGARLIEVGATNRVHLSDYEESLVDKPAAFLHAHRSNFRISGFTTEPELSEVAAAAHRAGILFIDDQGSGALLDTRRFGLEHEPTVQESLAAGADLVCFSGDKLLGGPQAGIIVGRAELVEKIRHHSLARALRADKLCLAALSATLLHYLKDEAEHEIPIWRMIAVEPSTLRGRAEAWAQALGRGEVIAGESAVGGGSLPGETLPTWLLALPTPKPDQLAKRLRRGRPPIIARVEADCVIFDPRTVLPEQEEVFLAGVSAA